MESIKFNPKLCFAFSLNDLRNGSESIDSLYRSIIDDNELSKVLVLNMLLKEAAIKRIVREKNPFEFYIDHPAYPYVYLDFDNSPKVAADLISLKEFDDACSMYCSKGSIFLDNRWIEELNALRKMILLTYCKEYQGCILEPQFRRIYINEYKEVPIIPLQKKDTVYPLSHRSAEKLLSRLLKYIGIFNRKLSHTSIYMFLKSNTVIFNITPPYVKFLSPDDFSKLFTIVLFSANVDDIVDSNRFNVDEMLMLAEGKRRTKCSYPYCVEKVYKDGYCENHYQYEMSESK